MQDTLLHEIEHAIWNAAGLKNFEDYDQEAIIRHTNAMRLDFIQRNPHIITYLLQQEETE